MEPFSCPHCSGLFQVPADARGQLFQCPHCGQSVQVSVERHAVPPSEQSFWPPGRGPAKQSTSDAGFSPEFSPDTTEEESRAKARATAEEELRAKARATAEEGRVWLQATHRRESRQNLKNLFVFGVCAVVLGVVAWLLVNYQPS